MSFKNDCCEHNLFRVSDNDILDTRTLYVHIHDGDGTSFKEFSGYPGSHLIGASECTVCGSGYVETWETDSDEDGDYSWSSFSYVGSIKVAHWFCP